MGPVLARAFLGYTYHQDMYLIWGRPPVEMVSINDCLYGFFVSNFLDPPAIVILLDVNCK